MAMNQSPVNQATHKQQSTHCHSWCQSAVFSQSFCEEDKNDQLVTKRAWIVFAP